jgi:hypothetical protein
VDRVILISDPAYRDLAVFDLKPDHFAVRDGTGRDRQTPRHVSRRPTYVAAGTPLRDISRHAASPTPDFAATTSDAPLIYLAVSKERAIQPARYRLRTCTQLSSSGEIRLDWICSIGTTP